MRKTSKRGGKEININRDGSSISIDKILSNGELGTRWYSEKEILEMSKLQELVKEKIKECKRNAGGMVYGMALESLVEESEK